MRSVTLGRLHELVADNLVDVDFRWTDDQRYNAVVKAYAHAYPLGIRGEVTASGSGDEWQITNLVTQPIERCRVKGTARGIPTLEEIPVRALRVSMNDEGTTRIRFPLPLPAGATVEILCIQQPPLPAKEATTDLVPFPWPELLAEYATAELFKMMRDQGTANDTMQADQLATTWDMSAAALKGTIIQSLGLPLFGMDEEKPKSKPKGKGK